MEENVSPKISKFKLPKSLTTVTTFSKILAMFLFVSFPFLGFYLGIKYDKATQKIEPELIIVKPAVITPIPSHGGGVVCTMEAKQCPDGSYVSRTGPNCEFSACSGEETKNWKTYSSKLGFSLKYPKEWFVVEKNEEVRIYNKNPLIYDFQRDRSTSSGLDYRKNDFIFEVNLISKITEDPHLIEKKQITVDNVAAFSGILVGGEGERMLMVHIARNNKTYDFYGKPADSEFKNYFDQILSTFKFSS